jgi:Ca2+-binding RTX toxin-like protein
MLAVLVLVAAFFATGASADTGGGQEAEDATCRGRHATIVGTKGDDVIRATTGRDVVYAGLGDDTIYGLLGNDVLCGGPGNDTIHGGRGNDLVDGGTGEDRVYGDLGDDQLYGGPGNHDEVAGGLGIDIVNGGPGNEDLVHGDYGWDHMFGGGGSADIASFATAAAGGTGSGVWVSLPEHKARGDGHDLLRGFESIEGSAFRDTLIGSKSANVIDGGPGDDTLLGGGGDDELNGEQGTDSCKGRKNTLVSCGKEKAPGATAYVQLDETAGGGAGLQVIGAGGSDDWKVGFDEATDSFEVVAGKGIAASPGCTRPTGKATYVTCAANGPARWLLADLGPGNDSLSVSGSLEAVGFVRLAGGLGNDTIHGGPEDDLIESGRGADKLYGEGGSDGLVGNLPGPTYIYGGADGDLLAAGGGCAGGALVGGPGQDDASFAETGAHPGTLIVSFEAHAAWIDVVKGCRKVHLSPSDEDMEGSFDNDILIGDSRTNAMLGQPGQDIFIGNGGGDTIDARDGVRDLSIDCGHGKIPHTEPTQGNKHHVPSKNNRTQPGGLALTDSFDPTPTHCAEHNFGQPVPGLPH